MEQAEAGFRDGAGGGGGGGWIAVKNHRYLSSDGQV
jgi:hypothetical protein